MPIKNENGNVVLFLASHKDITKRKISGEVAEQDVVGKRRLETEQAEAFLLSLSISSFLGKTVEKGNHIYLLTPRVQPWVTQSFLTIDSMDRTLKCDHSLESC